jgi:hypothetical protein
MKELKTIGAWVETINHHWVRLNGELNNNQEFWRECLHDVDSELWWTIVDSADAIRARFPDAWRNYNWRDIETVKRNLMLGKPVTKKFRTEYNRPAFRLAMNMKDFINELAGETSQQLLEQKPEKPTDFERHFE